MNKKNQKEILTEFNNSNFKKAYDLAINFDEKEKNEIILKILAISSFKIEKYSNALSYGLDYLKLQDRSEDIQILNIIGTSYSIIQDYEMGNKFLKEALLIDPKNINIRYNLGLNLYNQKKYRDSENQFNRIINNNRYYADSLLLYGIIQSELKNYKKSIDIFRELIEKDKYTSQSNYNLGIVYQKIGEYELSIRHFQNAIEYDNKQSQYYNSLGISFQKISNFEKAETCYEKAISLNKNYEKAYSNLALLKQKNGFFNDALKYFDIALEKKPKDNEILYNKSLCLLENGNFKEGLKLYKFRQNGKFISSDIFNLSNISNKKILITCDQGLGDIILLSRFVKILPNYGAKVTFQIPYSMRGLIKNLSSDIEITTKEILNINFDYKCTLGDLFEIFEVNKSNIPLTEDYLVIEKKWVDKWKNKIDNNKFNIGIAWQGKKGSIIDEGRSLKLKNFGIISNIKNINLISLQKNDGAEQIDEFNKNNNIINFGETLDAEEKFMDTAGLMKNLDLVISSDTSIIHLAGGLGVNAWLLLQKYPFWYWHTKDHFSIWYEKVKIFKQSENHNWEKLFLEIKIELENLIKNNFKKD